MRDYHEDGTVPEGDEIWVFGSNLAGRHGGGAALVARNRYQYPTGCGYGRVGQAYAIPTKDEEILTLPLGHIELGVHLFLQHARDNPDDTFWVTGIGCGLAGYTNEQIAPMFVEAPANCSFPLPWREFLEGLEGRRRFYNPETGEQGPVRD